MLGIKLGVPKGTVLGATFASVDGLKLGVLDENVLGTTLVITVVVTVGTNV